MSLRLALVVACVTFWAAPWSRAEAPAESRSGKFTAPRVLHQESPIFPAGIDRTTLPGTAEVRCTVDETGAVVAVRVLESSHPEFGAAAEAAAYRWRFTPALLDGKPIRRDVRIPFVFQQELIHPLEQALGRPVYVEPRTPPVAAETLERMPVPTTRAWPRYPEELRGTRTRGSVVLSFVIGPEGQVLNPEIISSTHEQFNLPATVAVLTLRFPPVLDAQGKALWVSMLLRYEFDESMLKEQDKEGLRRIVLPERAIPRTPTSLPSRPPRLRTP